MTPTKSLRSKVLLGYLVLVSATAVLGVWAVANFIILGGSIGQILQRNYRSVKAAQMMSDALERQDSAELMFLFGHQEQAENLFRSSETVFLEQYTRAKDNVTEPGEAEIIDSIGKLYPQYLLLFDQLKQSGNNGEFYLSTVKPVFDSAKETINNLLEINQDAMVRAERAAEKRSEFAVYSSLIISALAVIFGILFALKLSQIIIRPLQEVITAAREIGAGRLDLSVQAKSKDEIGVLAQEFNKMASSLREYHTMNLERLLAEQKKADVIVNTIRDCIVVTDQENRITLLNPAAELLFATTNERARGKHFLEVIKDEGLFQMINRTTETGQSPSPEEIKAPYIVGDGGARKVFRKSINPMKTEGGKLIGAVAVLQDITHLAEVDRMKSDFVSAVSHEFRTPLTSISMAVGLLREQSAGPVNDKQRELLNAAKEDVERLTRLVNNLLDLSRIESGRLELNVAPVDVARLLELSAEPFHMQLQERKIELAYDVKGTPAPVDADANKIGWVISNLIGNALRYTGPGGRITLGAIQKGERVHVSVEDTGTGIPPEYRERIFEKFFQVKESGAVESGGAGLGLAISREIVQAHGGRIWVESEEGKGSKFIFTLPVSRTAPPAKAKDNV